MLEHKGIPFKRTDLLPGRSPRWSSARSASPATRCPAMKIDGRRVQGSREIARELDRLQPEPPLFPADPEKRAAVEEAERFGDEELQHPIRQILWWALQARTRRRCAATRRERSSASRSAWRCKTAAPIVALSARFNEATDENVRADLAALPADAGPGRRLDRGRHPRRRGAERRRLPDRAEPAAWR